MRIFYTLCVYDTRSIKFILVQVLLRLLHDIAVMSNVFCNTSLFLPVILRRYISFGKMILIYDSIGSNRVFIDLRPCNVMVLRAGRYVRVQFETSARSAHEAKSFFIRRAGNRFCEMPSERHPLHYDMAL